jgi:hypothetical protein
MGKTENMALLHPGNISIPNMTAIETETNANYSTAINAQQYTANRHDPSSPSSAQKVASSDH